MVTQSVGAELADTAARGGKPASPNHLTPQTAFGRCCAVRASRAPNGARLALPLRSDSADGLWPLLRGPREPRSQRRATRASLTYLQFGEMPIYLDHAATTPLRREALDVMLPLLGEQFGNPSSVHGYGRAARAALDEARERFAAPLNAETREIIFTAGGTEAINLAVKGVAWAGKARGTRLVTSGVEHHAVMHALRHLEKFGFEVVTLPVDRYGRVDPEQLDAAINDRTILVSLLMANNEVGHGPAADRDHPPRAHSPGSGHPPRRGSGRAVHGDRHARARRRHDQLQRPQVRGAQGRRRALPAARNDPAAAAPRWRPGALSPRGHGERRRRSRHGRRVRARPRGAGRRRRRASPLSATGCATRSWRCPTWS